MGEQSQQSLTPDQAQTWVQQNQSSLKLSMNSNPVEFGALIGLFVALLFLFIRFLPAISMAEMRELLPQAQVQETKA